MNGKKLIASVIVSVTMGGMLLLNCKGDDGVVGPMGNANVIYSEWTYATGFADTIWDNSNAHFCYIRDSVLTDSVIRRSAVVVYMRFGGNSPMQLPYTSNAGGKVSTIAYWLRPGKVMPYRFTHDNSNSVNLSTVLEYRYVVIPGNTPDSVAAKGRVAKPDYSNYEEVCKKYGIPM